MRSPVAAAGVKIVVQKHHVKFSDDVHDRLVGVLIGEHYCSNVAGVMDLQAESAARDGVDIRLYRIIYDAIEEITTAMKGMLAPKFREVELGRAEVRQVYKISNVGTVAGCYVLSGKLTRNCEIRVVRDGIIVADDKIGSLKRFKDDAKEVTSGYECGVRIILYY